MAAVVALCKEAGVALVPQGGNTGLVGGSVPLAGEVVLSLRRLAGVTDVDASGWPALRRRRDDGGRRAGGRSRCRMGVRRRPRQS